MARTPSPRTAAGAAADFMLECPKCRWKAAPPAGWAAPFAVCPRCETRIPNPNPGAHVRQARAAGSKRKRPQKMPAGYEFSYSEVARKRSDAWIRNFTVIGFGLVAIAGTFWIVGKRRANDNLNKSDGQSAVSSSEGVEAAGATPLDGIPGSGGPGGAADLPDSSIGWDASVFNAPASTDEEGGIWNATEKPDAAPAPAASSSFQDPALPSFDAFD